MDVMMQMLGEAQESYAKGQRFGLFNDVPGFVVANIRQRHRSLVAAVTQTVGAAPDIDTEQPSDRYADGVRFDAVWNATPDELTE